MKTNLLTFLLFIISTSFIYSQPCTPLGDQTTYGTNNVWIGYVYDDLGFTGYNGFVNEGTTANSAFDESFTGDYVNYPVNGCPTYTETFSVRYKLIKNFADGDYEFTVGGDDGFRLSLDGGLTWVINRWNDQGYTTTTYTGHLSGNYNMVLEYYENGGGNRVSFNVQPVCISTGDQTIYGTGNIWIGYIYDGTGFNTYKGSVTEGSAGDAGFDESFGGANSVYNTSNCSTVTETFSARYRLRKNFVPGSYLFVLGGDDGYRLSLDGGATWVINNWYDQGYNTAGYFATLSGSYDMVIEFYENGGDNRISFSISGGVLPINLLGFTGEKKLNAVVLNWETTSNSTTDYFEIERSTTGNQFSLIGRTGANEGVVSGEKASFNFWDRDVSKYASFYRLKMVDLSGMITYSKTISFPADNLSPGIIIYPTISQGNIFLLPAKKLQNPSVVVYDLAGRKVFAKSPGTLYPRLPVPLLISANGALKGVYLLQVSNNNMIVETKKIILN